MKNMTNETHIEGLLYEHKLSVKVSGENSKKPGTTFITGEISIATDDNMVNIVPVHFSYVTATFASGAANATFAVLKNICDGVLKTVMGSSKETAARLRIDSALDLNDFYVEENGEDKLISTKRNEGGFVHLVDQLNPDEKTRNTFKCDMLITKALRVEANEEKQLPEKVVLKGAIFNFRKALLPVEFTVLNPIAMNYFEDLNPTSSEPILTKVWGRQESSVIVKTIVEESAFGEDSIREVTNTRKDFIITGAAKEVSVWDDESTITAEELTKAIADREVYLATVKRRQEEYKASKKTNSASAIASTESIIPADAGFKF